MMVFFMRFIIHQISLGVELCVRMMYGNIFDLRTRITKFPLK